MDERNFQLPAHLPYTQALFRQVFGTYRVPVPTRPGYTMSAELLGLDWLRLTLSGCVRKPLLSLVGPHDRGAVLWLQWLGMLVRKPSIRALELAHVSTLAELRDRATEPVLMVVSGPVEASMTTFMSLISNNTHFYNYNTKGRVTSTEEIRGTLLYCVPEPEGLDAFSCPLWVRDLRDQPAIADSSELLRQLQLELPTLFDLLLNKPFLTKMETDHWFTLDQITEPIPA